MSDLIRRSELLKVLSSMSFDFGNDTDDTETIIEMISETIKNQPTAYDIDKVVEELETEVERWEDSGKEYDDKCEIAVARGLRNAIEIVKQGCVSDDVCEWKLDGVYLHSPHKPLVSCVTDENYRYYYCPVCGKKIKVVE